MSRREALDSVVKVATRLSRPKATRLPLTHKQFGGVQNKTDY